jgi:proline iminopeptidase
MSLYPEIDPYDLGTLQVEEDDLIYWETCGNPDGKPAVVLHGGPGSGCTPWHRRLFDPDAYRLVLFDQRNCGRSRPHASEAQTDLNPNTTTNLVADIEQLRKRLGIDRWLLWGGSWGSTLALAYAETNPHRDTEMILWGITTGRRSEFDWWFRGGAAVFFPQQWARLQTALPVADRVGDIVAAYHRLLIHPDPKVHQPAAKAWCLWESAGLNWPPTDGLADRFSDPAYALAFARIVTRYVSHNAWLEDGAFLLGANSLAQIPGILVNGRFDFQAPIANAWELHQVWPRAELVIVDDAGHAPNQDELTDELIRASDRFARE